MIVQKNRDKEAIEYALSILSSEPFVKYIERIYLFGSYARKQNRYSSDVDILIECNENLNPEVARKMRIVVMPECIDMPEIDLKFVKKDKWRERGNQFSKNLLKEGVLLWKKK